MDTRFTLNALVPLLPTHPGNSRCSDQGTLIDLAEVDTPSSSSPVLAPVSAPPTSGIPILPPPPQTCGPPRSRSSSQAEAPPGPDSMNNALSLLDEELLCLGMCKHGTMGREACAPGLRVGALSQLTLEATPLFLGGPSDKHEG